MALSLSLTAWAWIFHFEQYYRLPAVDRPGSVLHDWLRPSGTVGLATGALAAALIVANLCYLVRRSAWGRSLPGSLQGWMTSHVGTGVLALLLVMIHSAMAPHHTVGGHAFLALVVLVITGSIGRYLYAFVPRAANGQELALDEINQIVESESAVENILRDYDRKSRTPWPRSMGIAASSDVFRRWRRANDGGVRSRRDSTLSGRSRDWRPIRLRG